jgi:hypothetical protein
MTNKRSMFSRLAVAAAVLACGAALGAAMTKDEYKAASERIATEYQVERQKCGDRHGNVADLCIARAHGARKVAKAELEATYKPSPRTNYEAAIARADAAYVIAKEECDDRKDAERKGCMKDAEAARERAKEEAKAKQAAR